jgi:ABC-2 type transport system permease protein
LSLVLTFLRREFLIATSYRFQFLFHLLGSFFSVVTFYYISQIVGPGSSSRVGAEYGSDYFSYVLIGVAAAGLVDMATMGFNVRLRQTMTEGSLEMMFATPAHPLLILSLPAGWSYVFDSTKAAAVLLFGVLLFGADLSRANVPVSLAVVLVALLAYSVLGLFSIVFVIVIKRGDPVTWAASQAAIILGGAYFPLDMLPAWLEPVARVLPMTYAFRALRGTLLRGDGFAQVGPDLLVLLGFALVGLPLAALACRRAIDTAKREGTLGAF